MLRSRCQLLLRSSCIASASRSAPGTLVSRSRHYSSAVAHDTIREEPATKQLERGFKRFWKSTSVGETNEGLRVLLDQRPLKTPDGRPLTIPSEKRLLATLLAGEWERQQKVLKGHTLPLTSLVARGIDGLETSEDRKAAIDKLMKFLETDSVCYQQSYPETLVGLQHEYFDPVLEWAEKTYDVKFSVTKELLSADSHPERTTSRLRQEVENMDPMTLAAFEKATIITKSFLISLALVRRAISVSFAARAARVEVMTQIKFWGEVEDTHDVDEAQMGQQLGAVVCLVM